VNLVPQIVPFVGILVLFGSQGFSRGSSSTSRFSVHITAVFFWLRDALCGIVSWFPSVRP
jgi:hypothetical protein